MHDPLDLVYVPRCQRIEHAVVPDPQAKPGTCTLECLDVEVLLVAAELDQRVQYPAGLGAGTDPAEIPPGLSC